MCFGANNKKKYVQLFSYVLMVMNLVALFLQGIDLVSKLEK